MAPLLKIVKNQQVIIEYGNRSTLLFEFTNKKYLFYYLLRRSEDDYLSIGRWNTCLAWISNIFVIFLDSRVFLNGICMEFTVDGNFQLFSLNFHFYINFIWFSLIFILLKSVG